MAWQDTGNLDGDNNPDSDIYYAIGDAAGFGAPVLISNGAQDGASVAPRIALTPDGCPHVVWHDSGRLVAADNDSAEDVYYRGASRSGGACTFGPIVLVSSEASFDRAQAPALAAHPSDARGLLYVAWHATGAVTALGESGATVLLGDAANTDSEVYLRSVMAGMLGPLIGVSDYAMDGVSTTPDVAVETTGVVHIVLVDSGPLLGSGNDADVFSRSWNGMTLTQPEHVSDSSNNANMGLSVAPRIAVRGARRIITWSDGTDYDTDGVADLDVMCVVR